MIYVIVVIVIWVVVAFIRSKIKNESFLDSMIQIPISLFSIILNEVSTHHTDYSSVESRARKEGRDDVLNEIAERKQKEENLRQAAKDLKEKFDEKRK